MPEQERGTEKRDIEGRRATERGEKRQRETEKKTHGYILQHMQFGYRVDKVDLDLFPKSFQSFWSHKNESRNLFFLFLEILLLN